MIDFFDIIGIIGIENMEQIVTGIVRILLAAFCGAFIGIERGRKHRPAGLRTHMLVCVAAALVMVTNEQLIQAYGTGDPTRMGAQVISGIGFLGAGTILTDKQNRIRGLTTAAGLWASACVGLAIGGGYYIGGLLTCLLILAIFTKFISIEQYIVKKSRMMDINVSFENPKYLNNFINEITSLDCNVVSFEVIENEEEKPDKISSAFKKKMNANLLIWLPENNFHSEVLQVLESSKGMLSMEEL